MVAGIRDGEVEKIEVEGNKLHVTYIDGTIKTSKKEAGESLAGLLNIYGVTDEQIAGVSIEGKEPGGAALWVAAIAPFLIPLLLMNF